MSANRRRQVSSSLLPVGHYTITTQKQGFEPFTLSDVVVNVNENLRVDVPLILGKVPQSISVNTNVVEVETRSATLGKVIDEAKNEPFLGIAMATPSPDAHEEAKILTNNYGAEFGGKRLDRQYHHQGWDQPVPWQRLRVFPQ